MVMTTLRNFARNDDMPLFAVSCKRVKGFGNSAEPVSDDTNIALAKAIGARMLRKDFFWADGEPQAGVYDFSTLISFLRKNAAANLKPPVIILNRGCNAHTGGYGTPPTTTAAIDAFASFAAAAVAAAQDAGFTAYWELMNEPNSPAMWGGPPDPVAYGKLVTKAALAMKAVRQTCSVITAGLAVGGQDFMAPGSYLAAMLPHIDVSLLNAGNPLHRLRAFGAHPYQGGDLFMSDATHWPEAVLSRMEGWRPSSASQILMHNTEQGVAACECAGQTWAEKEERQAVLGSRIRLSMLLCHGFGTWYNLINDGTDQTANEHNFGAYYFDQTLKPVGRALAALNAIINPSIAAILQKDGDSYQGIFTMPVGPKQTILWAANGQTIINPGSNPIIVTTP